jgi:hypothetical protein
VADRGRLAVRNDRLAAPALVALALLAHAPALVGGWIIDDADYVVDNRRLDDAPGLATIWREPRALPVYYPFVFTTFWAERRL